jgi:hypothetical protein
VRDQESDPESWSLDECESLLSESSWLDECESLSESSEWPLEWPPELPSESLSELLREARDESLVEPRPESLSESPRELPPALSEVLFESLCESVAELWAGLLPCELVMCALRVPLSLELRLEPVSVERAESRVARSLSWSPLVPELPEPPPPKSCRMTCWPSGVWDSLVTQSSPVARRTSCADGTRESLDSGRRDPPDSLGCSRGAGSAST